MSLPATWNAMEDAIHAWVVAGSGLPATSVRWAQQTDPRPAGPYISVRLRSLRGVGHDWVDVEENPLVFADKVISAVNAGADTVTSTAHGLLTGDGPVRLTTTGTLPGGLAAATDYWAIRVDANTLQFAATFLGAVETPTPVAISDAGTGAHAIVDTTATRTHGAEISLVTRGVRRMTIAMQAFAGPDGASIGATAPLGLLHGVALGARTEARTAALNAGGVGILSLGPVQSIDGKLGAGLFEPRALLEAQANVTAELAETATYVETVEVTNEVTAVTFEISAA